MRRLRLGRCRLRIRVLGLEHSLFGERRAYAAIAAPLVGLTAGVRSSSAGHARPPRCAGGELTALARGGAPPSRRLPGGEVDRTLVLELERASTGVRARCPDAPAEVGLRVSVLRPATPGAVAAGPVLFERLDWRPYGVRPVPPLAAQVPPGEPTRLDPFRAQLAVQLQSRLAAGPEDPELLEALERWELALFHEGPLRSDELREALEALFGCDEGAWAAA